MESIPRLIIRSSGLTSGKIVSRRQGMDRIHKIDKIPGDDKLNVNDDQLKSGGSFVSTLQE